MQTLKELISIQAIRGGSKRLRGKNHERLDERIDVRPGDALFDPQNPLLNSMTFSSHRSA